MMGGSRAQSTFRGATPSHPNATQSYTAPAQQHQHQHSASPAPIQHPHQFTQQSAVNLSHAQHASPNPSQLNHYSTPLNRYAPQATQRPSGTVVHAQRPQEIWRLPENANLAIPEDVRGEFQQDDQGHVLFWTAPPISTLPPAKPGSALGHTARYLADRIRAKKVAQEKRKADAISEDEQSRPQRDPKRIQRAADNVLQQQLEDLQVKALTKWNEQLQASTDSIYKKLYGRHWEEGKKYELEKLSAKQAEYRTQRIEMERAHAQPLYSWNRARAALAEPVIYKDDFDPRY